MGKSLTQHQLIEIFSDSAALEILNGLKPGFSVRGLEERRRVVQGLDQQRHPASRERLLGAGLLVRSATGDWSIPEERRRLVYQIVSAQRDESSLLSKIQNFAADQDLPITGGPWLDVACGAGSFLRTARQVLRVPTLGTDLDTSALMVAQAADTFENRPGTYQESPAHQIQAASRSFAVVTSLVAFQHFLVRESLHELTRCLADRGVLFLRLHGSGYYIQLAMRYLRKKILPVYALRCLFQGVLLQLGLDQDRSLQDGWLKLESPLGPNWMIRQLGKLGFADFQVEVLESYLGFPVFFDLCAARRG